MHRARVGERLGEGPASAALGTPDEDRCGARRQHRSHPREALPRPGEAGEARERLDPLAFGRVVVDKQRDASEAEHVTGAQRRRRDLGAVDQGAVVASGIGNLDVTLRGDPNGRVIARNRGVREDTGAEVRGLATELQGHARLQAHRGAEHLRVQMAHHGQPCRVAVLVGRHGLRREDTVGVVGHPRETLRQLAGQS